MSDDGQERPWWASDPPGGERASAGDTGDDPAADGAGGGGGGGRGGADAPRGEPGAAAWPHRDGELCQLCPICAFLRVAQETRPEAMEHLIEAAHHLTLAAKAVVDAHADGFDRDGVLERIELDDD